ncbi:glycoside hydrolase family 31 protein [Actinomyces ruminis]|uniref:Glycoside hydrolase family 31 protein n=1 Tax=Actinomyces ruminis TaxID=1937003 RepID=A0ABX4MBH0_9ACTO|nr:glycoside hydrolase family 31 protein [Actinomyces ruminis]PHP52805.1 glycoside hydrolase family 31 protein [Actinomyces ruminis]
MQLLNKLTSCVTTPSGLSGTLDGRHSIDIEILDNDLARVWIRRDGESRLTRTWTVVAGDDDVPWEGRDRSDTSGFPRPPVTAVVKEDGSATIESGRIRLTVSSDPFRIDASWKGADGWHTLVSDRATGAYYLGSDAVEGRESAFPYRTDVAHFQYMDESNPIFGLGDKTGPLDRMNGRYELSCQDAMGYDSTLTDPLYKHTPFTITKTPNGSFGVFYDNLAHGSYDLGKTKDNYHKRFRTWRADDGDIDYYLMFGDAVEDVTRAFVRLTGRPQFPPKWTLNYSQSTMTYPDAPDASDQLLKFIDLVKKHRIPCGSFQMGSGYTSINGKRYYFHWNRDKFPDPAATIKAFHDAGMNFTANIKPCFLIDHPMYEEMKELGLFIKDPRTGGPEVSAFWDEQGSHLDFTNPEAVEWWKKQVKEQLLEYGIDVAWNDNNEFEVWDENAICDGFGDPLPVGLMRPVQSMLMIRASLDAQSEFDPERRQFSVVRSGGPGIQRYAQTWSGDNYTSWQTIKGNIRQGLSMTLSGMYNTGHDVGGFAGPAPDAELLTRWIEHAITSPRFLFNSWHDDQTVNEPWTHLETLDSVRETINLRTRMAPFMYNLLHEASENFEPILHPTFTIDESDPELWKDTDDFLLGHDILVAAVTEPGQRRRKVYLPQVAGGWYDPYTGDHYRATRTHVFLDAPLDRLPALVRAGSAIPTGGIPEQSAQAKDDERTLNLFPPVVGDRAEGVFYDDDGKTNAYLDGEWLKVHWTQEASEEAVDLTVAFEGSYKPEWEELYVRLPKGDRRQLRIHVAGGAPVRVVSA